MAQTQTITRADDRPLTLRQQLDRQQPEFAKLLTGCPIPVERFVRTAQTALITTRNADKAKPKSFLAACMKAATDGLILDGREAALVIDNQGEVSYRPMMRGILRLAYNSGQIKSLAVEAVRKNDFFKHVPSDPLEPIRHEIDHREDRGDVYAFYALAQMVSGGVVHEVMSLPEVNAIRDRSDAWKAYKAQRIKSTPWATDPVEMGRKTVFRRISKYLPSSSDRDALISAAERIDDDYTFDHEPAAGEPPQPTPMRPTKRRGGAAAALKDVTPKAGQQQPADEANDQHTGEVFDQDDGPDAGDPRFAGLDMQEGDDI